ncbi:hypothetical protein OAS95_01105 [Pelagibacteraceae bacterium]|jgi:hypothetical protein|nr:hypothetical protein [Pelagibacteraceae bacterium]
MSLVATASSWTNDESSNRKRTPSIRKTIKIRPQETVNEFKYENNGSGTIEQFKSSSDERTSRVTDLLDKLTSSDDDDNNNKMGDFKPISPPKINSNSDYSDDTEIKQYIPPVPKYSGGAASANILGEMKNYGANDTHSQTLSNYNQSYNNKPIAASSPYYAKMGITGASSSGDTQLMEKINYMIHLLEDQQHEKTANITEEFLLYTFMGVFVIFIVDSFARAGKYTR